MATTASEGYQPLETEPYVDETVVKTVAKKRKSKRRRGGKAKAALLLGLLTLVLCLIALAIALPIVLSARSSDVSAGRSMPTGSQGFGGNAVGPNAAISPLGDNSMGVSAFNSQPAGASPSTPGTATNPQNLPLFPAGGAAPSPLVGPDMNVNGAGGPSGTTPGLGAVGAATVYCYRGTNGQLFPGGLRKTGVTESANGVLRSEVESCDSRNKYALLDARLEPCAAVCQTPVWLGLQEGLVQPALWAQDFVCRDGSVFYNQRQTQATFYLKYNGVEQETLVSECNSDNSFWIPQREMRNCTTDEQDTCNALNLARATPRGLPTILPGEPGATIRSGPVCIRSADNVMLATGVTRNRLLWWRFKRVSEAEVKGCNAAVTATASSWIDVSMFVNCSATAAASCAGATVAPVLVAPTAAP